ncbi:MAG: thrombospondin type 3 repeat-containing protein, partial [Patescibacteria group bacterium]
MWHKFRANKNIIIASIIGLSIIGFTYFSSKDFPQQTAYKNTYQKSVNDITLGQLIGKDTDGDGLKDWEEMLWGTDPNKK